eukprot:11170227-Prorocentrum_lima.AAC.1
MQLDNRPGDGTMVRVLSAEEDTCQAEVQEARERSLTPQGERRHRGQHHRPRGDNRKEDDHERQ